MSTLRIALDATPLAASHTGIWRYTVELARNLALARPDAEVVLLSGEKYEPVDGPPNLRCNLRPARAWEHRWWSVGLPVRLRQMGASLFHGTDFAVPLLGAIPSVLTIHDLSPFRAAEWRMPATAKRIARRLPSMAWRAKIILTPSERIQQEVVDRFKVPAGKVRVTPLAAAPAFIRKSPNHQITKSLNPFVLYSGAIEPRKNLLRLLRAFSRLKGPETLVLAGGGGWGRDEVVAAVNALGLQSRVKLVGHVSDEEMAALYSQAAVFVYVSIYEGFGLPIVEAMACGARIVTSRNTACADVAGDAAILVDPENEEAIADAIDSVLKNAELSATLHRKSLARASEFSWTRTAELTWQAYEDALSRS